MSTHGKQAVSAWQTPTQTQIHVIVHIHMERHKYMIVREKIQGVPKERYYSKRNIARIANAVQVTN